MMAFILATDFDFIAYMSKMAFFFFFLFLLKLFSRQWCFWNMIIFLSKTETENSFSLVAVNPRLKLSSALETIASLFQ